MVIISGSVEGVPVKFNNKKVGTATVFSDGSIEMSIALIDPSDTGEQIYDLLRKGMMGHFSFACELNPARERT